MPLNGSGTFTRLYNWVTDKANAIKIRADRMDAEFDGIVAALSMAMYRDGQGVPTANIPFGNRRLTNLADATAATDALNRQTADSRYLQSSTYDANTIIKADADNTPEALTIAEQRIIGRLTGGEITGLTDIQVAEFVRAATGGFLGAVTITGPSTSFEFLDTNDYLQIKPQDYASNKPALVFGTDGTGWRIRLSDGIDTDGNLELLCGSLTHQGNPVLCNTDTTLEAGFASTVVDDGTKSSGTYTPDWAGGNFRKITNGGAFVLAAPSAGGDYTMVIRIVNGGSSGAITFSGFETIDGDSYATTSSHRYLLFITVVDGQQYATLKRIV